MINKLIFNMLSRVLAVGFAPIVVFIFNDTNSSADLFVSIWLLVSLCAIVDQISFYSNARISVQDKDPGWLNLDLAAFFFICYIFLASALAVNLFLSKSMELHHILLCVFGLTLAMINSLLVFKTVLGNPLTTAGFRLFLYVLFIAFLLFQFQIELGLTLVIIMACLFIFISLFKDITHLYSYKIKITHFAYNFCFAFLGVSLIQLDKYIVWVLDAPLLADYYLTYSLIFLPIFGFWIPIVSMLKPYAPLPKPYNYVPIVAVTLQFFYVVSLDNVSSYLDTRSLLDSGSAGTLFLYISSLTSAAALRGLIIGYSNGALEVFGKRNILTFTLGVVYIVSLSVLNVSVFVSASIFCLVVNIIHFVLSCYLDYDDRSLSIKILAYVCLLSIGVFFLMNLDIFNYE